jgi:predicted membrane protein
MNMDMPPDVQPARKPTIVFAVCLIATGVLLFLGNLGLFPIHRIWDLWPLLFVFIGFGRLAGRRTPGRILMGAAFVVLGIIATLFTTGVFQLRFHDDSWFISLLLIAFGVVGLARVLDGEPWHFGDRRYGRKWARRQQRRMARGDSGGSFSFEATMGPDKSSDTDPVLSDHTIMGHIKRSVQSQNFEGGKLTSILGNIEIDLRRAKMPEGRKTAQLELEVIMGHVALRVPDSWRVIWNGENMLGNFEDRTIPPNTGAAAPELIVSGSCTMGSIEIES